MTWWWNGKAQGLKGGAGEQGGVQWIDLGVNAIIYEQLGAGDRAGKPYTRWWFLSTVLMAAVQLLMAVMWQHVVVTTEWEQCCRGVLSA